MGIEEIKESMLNYIDLIGGHLLDKCEIQHATSKEDLSEIIDRHYDHLSDIANDAQRSLERYKKTLGL